MNCFKLWLTWSIPPDWLQRNSDVFSSDKRLYKRMNELALETQRGSFSSQSFSFSLQTCKNLLSCRLVCKLKFLQPATVDRDRDWGTEPGLTVLQSICVEKCHCQFCYLEENPQFDSEDEDLLCKKSEMSVSEKPIYVSNTPGSQLLHKWIITRVCLQLSSTSKWYFSGFHRQAIVPSIPHSLNFQK